MALFESQQQEGREANETMELRTMLRWMLPPIGSTAMEAVCARGVGYFFEGNREYNLPAHRGPFFTDLRAAKYTVSKVIDRHCSMKNKRCPFIGK